MNWILSLLILLSGSTAFAKAGIKYLRTSDAGAVYQVINTKRGESVEISVDYSVYTDCYQRRIYVMKDQGSDTKVVTVRFTKIAGRCMPQRRRSIQNGIRFQVAPNAKSGHVDVIVIAPVRSQLEVRGRDAS